jgi:glucose uptake protein GlcU
VVSAILISTTGNKTTLRRHTTAGILYALLAACCYASYLYPMKLAVLQIGPWEFTPWMALGILITTILTVVLRREGRRQFFSYPPRVYGLSLLGGASWTIALICMNASMRMIDLSVAWSLSQLNTIPAVFLGSLVFHEVHFATHRRLIFLGLLAATIGTCLLGWAKR